MNKIEVRNYTTEHPEGLVTCARVALFRDSDVLTVDIPGHTIETLPYEIEKAAIRHLKAMEVVEPDA